MAIGTQLVPTPKAVIPLINVAVRGKPHLHHQIYDEISSRTQDCSSHDSSTILRNAHDDSDADSDVDIIPRLSCTKPQKRDIVPSWALSCVPAGIQW